MKGKYGYYYDTDTKQVLHLAVITGTHALRLAERDNLTLHCHANPIDNGGVVTVEQGREIAREDAGLLYVVVTPNGWTAAETAGYHVEDYFRDAQYLGPDWYGVEPTWTDLWNFSRENAKI